MSITSFCIQFSIYSLNRVPSEEKLYEHLSARHNYSLFSYFYFTCDIHLTLQRFFPIFSSAFNLQHGSQYQINNSPGSPVIEFWGEGNTPGVNLASLVQDIEIKVSCEALSTHLTAFCYTALKGATQ